MRDKIVTERKPHLLCRKRLPEVHFGLRQVPKGGRAAGPSRGAHEHSVQSRRPDQLILSTPTHSPSQRHCHVLKNWLPLASVKNQQTWEDAPPQPSQKNRSKVCMRPKETPSRGRQTGLCVSITNQGAVVQRRKCLKLPRTSCTY